jgi:hypothetical protein
LGAAGLARPVLIIGGRTFVPLALRWHGVRVSALMPYTWFVRIPALDAFREADRLALLGLLPAALLAGGTVEWLWRRSRPLLIVVLALAVLEAGYSGYPRIGTVPTAIPRLDGPIAADHSGSIVVDIRFGLRGGVALYGREISPDALVLATADGHPRAVSVTSWVSASSVAAIRAARAATSRWPRWRCRPCSGTGVPSRCGRAPTGSPTLTGPPGTRWRASVNRFRWRRRPWSGPGPGWPPALPRQPRCR